MDQSKGGISGAAAQSSAANFLVNLIDTLQEPILVLDKEFVTLSANLHFYNAFSLGEGDVLGNKLSAFKNSSWNKIELQEKISNAFSEKRNFSDLEFSFSTPESEELIFTINGAIIQDGDREFLLLSFKRILEDIYHSNSLDFKSLESILEHAPAMICILRGPDFVFELANQNYYQLIGQRSIIGKPVREAIPEAEEQGFVKLLEEVKRSGEAFQGIELPIKLKINEIEEKNSFLDFVYQPLFDDRGEVDGIFVHVIDVTEKVLVRKQIEQSEAELREIIDTVPAMIWITNEFGESVYLNKNWYNYTGQNLKRAEGYGWVDVVHPEDQKFAEESFRKADKERKPFSASFRLKNKNGDYRWVIDSGHPKYSIDGKYEGMIGTVVDVHEEKVKEQALANTQHQYRELIHSSTSLISTFKGEDYIIEIANDAIIEAWGKDHDVIGKPLLKALPELVEQGFDQILKDVYTTGIPYRGYEMPINLERDGKMELFHFNFIYSPQRNINGDIVGIVNVATEVTTQAVLNKTIRESESHFRQMADLMPTKVSNTDATGEFIYFNQEWLDYTGLSLDELRVYGWEKLIHDDQKEIFLKNWKSSLKTGEKFEMEINFKKQDETYSWHIHRAEAVKDEQGRIKTWIGTTVNIQEQKEVMESLEYSKALLETHNQANLDGILLVDTKGKMISFNQRFVDIWNMPTGIVDALNDKEALEFASKQLITPEDFLRDVENVYDSPNQVCKDILKFRDGKIIERHGYPVVGIDGTFYAWSWTFRDITLEKNQEKSIKESELYFRQMTDLMPGMIVNTDNEGNPTYFNEHWLKFTGTNKEDLKAQGWIRFIHPNEQEKFKNIWNRSLETGENFEMEIKLRNVNGKYKWHISRAEAVRDEAGKIKMWICVNTEIQKLKEEEKRKGDFLKMVSHELKTPVTSIKGYVQLLLTMLKKEELGTSNNSLPLKPSLERIDHQIKRLTRLISEMLDLSRIEENKLELKKQVFSLNKLVDETVQDIRYTNTQHHIEVVHEFRCKIRADKDRIGQVLINFVTNAIKYSPESQDIVIKVQKQKNNQVSVSVKDQGIGIEKKNHKNIFKRFYRIGGKGEETYAGFGIGLYLAKEIIERHNGSITVKSKKGKGSDFCFILSVAPEE